MIVLEKIKSKKILFVNVSKTYNKCKHKNEKCVTLGNWRINIERAKKVDYVMGVCSGKIVSVIAIKDAKQLISGFEEGNFPCCNSKNCNRYLEKLRLKEFSKKPNKYKNDLEYQRFSGRVYFIEDENVDVTTVEKVYLRKQLLIKDGKKKFSNYVRYVNV